MVSKADYMTDAALILIDLQRCMADPELPARNNQSAETNIVRLLTDWRFKQRPVIHVRHLSVEPDSGFRPGQSGAEFQDAFMPRAGDLQIRSISHVVFVGVATNNSVEATVRSAGCLGFKNTVVSDACFTFARTDVNGVECSANAIHFASLSNLCGEYAAIKTTDEVLAAS
jgi:nicotinamidase-related amidase